MGASSPGPLKWKVDEPPASVTEETTQTELIVFPASTLVNREHTAAIDLSDAIVRRIGTDALGDGAVSLTDSPSSKSKTIKFETKNRKSAVFELSTVAGLLKLMERAGTLWVRISIDDAEPVIFTKVDEHGHDETGDERAKATVAPRVEYD